MELKDLKKQNKMIFSMYKTYVLHCDIKNTREKYSKRRIYYISDTSIRDLDSDLYLSNDSKWYEIRQPTECKDTNRLDLRSDR